MTLTDTFDRWAAWLNGSFDVCTTAETVERAMREIMTHDQIRIYHEARFARPPERVLAELVTWVTLLEGDE